MSVSSYVLESPKSLLCFSPTREISRGFMYLDYVGGRRWDGRSGAFQFFSLVGHHIL